MPRLRIATLGLCLSLLAPWAPAQKTAPRTELTVIVLNSHADPAQPVQGVRVSLSFVNGAEKIVDARDATNRAGQALLLVSQDAAQRGDLRIEISGVSDLVIYQPADGQLAGLPSTVKIQLLPKGSAALLGPVQIEAMLHRALLQVNSLEKENRFLKTEVATAQSQKQDLGPALSAWALANGFSASDVDQRVQQWAQQIQQDSAHATLQQKALAEVALKHYASAAKLFNQAADADSSELDAEEQAFLSARRDKLRQLINDREQSAGADQLALQYRQATQTLESSAATAEAEYHKHADDAGFHLLWLDALRALADGRRQEAEIAPGSQSLAMLAQSATAFDSLRQQYLAMADPQDAAVAQLGLADTLAAQADRSQASNAGALFDQAVQNYLQVLNIDTRENSPLQWANAQIAMGWALKDQGIRAGGDKAVSALTQSAQAFRNALEVYTRTDHPRNWADAQSDLGAVLIEEGDRTVGDQAAKLYTEAVQSLHAALDIYTRANYPEKWAGIQQSLGMALKDEGQRAGSAQASALLDQSIEALRSSLEVVTEADLPQDWAAAQGNLGNTLVRAGEHASGSRAIAFYEQAVQAFQLSLRVYTMADLPQEWARNESNLSLALMNEGELSSGPQAIALFQRSADACRQALQVFTETELPQYWATSEENLGDALVSEALRTSGDQAAGLLNQAVEAWRNALRVDTRAVAPQQWTEIQMNIMEASLISARFDTCLDQAVSLSGDSVSSSQAVVRDTMAVACQWGDGNASAALAADRSMAEGAARLKGSVWDFSGSLRFLTSSPRFATGRDSWIALFTAVQNGDGAGMLAALNQLQSLMEK